MIDQWPVVHADDMFETEKYPTQNFSGPRMMGIDTTKTQTRSLNELRARINKSNGITEGD